MDRKFGTLDSWLKAKASSSPRPDRPPNPPAGGSSSIAGEPARQSDPRREALRLVCKETLAILPPLLNRLQSHNAALSSSRHSLESLPRLQPHHRDHPGFPDRARIVVTNEDTLNAAIRLASRLPQRRFSAGGIRPSVAVLNFANRRYPGGGWRNGAVAQEESICYRSSLAMSIENASYPLDHDEALYSPYVLVVRHEMGGSSGHRLINSQAEDLPAVSVLTVAAIFKPAVKTITLGNNSTREEFALDRERNHAKDKMRLTLRMAAHHGHTSLVLGALGCGVFQNPPEDVAHCWLEVLKEHEFSGRPWRDVCFAVYDPRNEGNYDIFSRILHGKRA